MNIQKDYSLKDKNSFGVDVKARYAVLLTAQEELPKIKTLPKPHLILGGGSNILFTQDYPGTVIVNQLKGIQVLEEDREFARVRVMSGENWHQLVLKMNKDGYHGLEYLALIPGSVGAAPVQNIGAYGAEIKDYIEKIEVYNFVTERREELKGSECQFGYRESIFKANPGIYFIISVTFKLYKRFTPNLSYRVLAKYFGYTGEKVYSEEGEHSQKITARSLMEAVISIRSSKLPDPKELGNGGSFFKNPLVSKKCFDALKLQYPSLLSFEVEEAGKVKLAAGQLIELAGFKGQYVGSVGMYEKQALVLVNLGGATGQELAEHAARVQKGVYEKFSIRLEPEPSIL